MHPTRPTQAETTVVHLCIKIQLLKYLETWEDSEDLLYRLPFLSWLFITPTIAQNFETRIWLFEDPP